MLTLTKLTAILTEHLHITLFTRNLLTSHQHFKKLTKNKSTYNLKQFMANIIDFRYSNESFYRFYIDDIFIF